MMKHTDVVDYFTDEPLTEQQKIKALEKARLNIQYLGLDKNNQNFVEVFFRNDSSSVFLNKHTGLCIDSESGRVSYFDFEDDMFYITGEESAFHQEQQDWNLYELQYHGMEGQFDTSYMKSIPPFYPILPRKEDIIDDLKRSMRYKFKRLEMLSLTPDAQGYYSILNHCQIRGLTWDTPFSFVTKIKLDDIGLLNYPKFYADIKKWSETEDDDTIRFTDLQLSSAQMISDEISNEDILSLMSHKHIKVMLQFDKLYCMGLERLLNSRPQAA